MASIFSKIVAGEIPAYKILEDDEFLAFLDINPVAEGHTLVIPKQEIDYIFDISDEMLAKMNIFAKKVAIALNKAIECKRVGILVVGTEVPHAHIHLIPFQNESQMSLASPKLKFSSEQMQSIQQKIIANL
jgi:histidine triad (HIT) family protein